jgi:hypothetical protein
MNGAFSGLAFGGVFGAANQAWAVSPAMAAGE